MDDQVRHEIGVYFEREARQTPPGVRERVLARLAEAATRPAPRARRSPTWPALVASVLVATATVGALVVANLAGRQQPAASPGPVLPRAGAAVTYAGTDGAVLLIGGAAGRSVLGDMWAWDGRGWTEVRPATLPPARQDALAVYDPAHRAVVLFGGFGRSDTWTWDGREWTRRTTPTGPPATAADMIYDPSSNTVLLTTYAKGETDALWRWDGRSWTKLANGGVAASGRLVFDGRRVLLVGQQGTWAWDGRAWSRLSPATPLPALPIAGAAFDGVRRRVVALVAGPAGPETWTWDGATWSRAHPAHEPVLSPGGRLVGGGGAGLWFDGAQLWAWDGRDWTLAGRKGGHG